MTERAKQGPARESTEAGDESEVASAYVAGDGIAARSSRILPNLPRAAGMQKRSAAPYEPICAVFRRSLKRQGLKFTPERALILDAVLGREGLFDADQLVEELRDRTRKVSRATVYRTLGHLQDAGIVKQVFFDNRQSYWEVIAGRQAYDYLICVETGRVVEFSSEKIRKVRDAICRELGFEPIGHQLQIFGISPEAQQGELPEDSSGREGPEETPPPG